MAVEKISDSNADQRKFACKQMRLALENQNEVPIHFIAATLAIDIGPEESVILSLRDTNLTNEEKYLLARLYVNHKTPKHSDYFLAKTIVENLKFDQDKVEILRSALERTLHALRVRNLGGPYSNLDEVIMEAEEALKKTTLVQE